MKNLFIIRNLYKNIKDKEIDNQTNCYKLKFLIY